MKNIFKKISRHRLGKIVPVLALSAVIAGCANVTNPVAQDPFESYNRSMYAFNDTVDRALLKPIATGYETVVPKPARTCVAGIFNNLQDVWSSFNSFLQGRAHDGINMFGRVLFNSTMGLGGCIDVASMNGSQRIINDFGVTLGVWGFDSGPYLILPFLGSSSVRDGISTAAWFAIDISPPYAPIFEIDNIPLRNSILALAIVDLRAGLLPADRMVDEIALDRYSFIRDAYIQRRQALVEGRHANTGHTTSRGLPTDDQGLSVPDYSIDDEPTPSATPAQPAGQ
ncbi:MAG: VacJ family lipoprotein [Pusillimonas sp.]